MTPLPRPLKALGVAGIAASLMLAPLPAHAEGNNLYRNPVNFILAQLVTVSWISNTDAAR